MCKERLFQKQVTINNFKLVNLADLDKAGKSVEGELLTEEALILAEVFYTPKGYRGEIHAENPIRTWDLDHAKRLLGISNEFPEGDLKEKNFETALAAMQFLTKRLKRLGWEPLTNWQNP